MKTFVSTCFAAALVLLSSTSFATVWRVNNQTVPPLSANFTNINTAIGSALVQPGDTLYIEASANSYGGFNLTKRLTIIGTGYFLTENDTTQANPNRSLIGNVTFSNGSQGSVITGMQIDGCGGAVTFNTNDITVDRCYINHNPCNSGTVMNIASNLSGITVRRSFLYSSSTTTGTSRLVVNIGAGAFDILFENNIIKRGTKTGGVGRTAITMTETSFATFRNNVVMGDVVVFNSTYTNNIHISGNFVPNAFMVAVSNNLGNLTQYGTANGNQQNVNMTNVFTNGPSNENVDNHYRLAVGSPAIEAGISGVDCGAYGGTRPYVLSGMPAIPAIFDISYTNVVISTESGLEFNVKSKAHD